MSSQRSRDQFVIRDVALILVRICTENCRLFCLFLQIATFFSNNLDFFTSPAYSPKGSTMALSPLQAETMLANKKKASAYIHAIKKVYLSFAHFLLNIMVLVDLNFVKKSLSPLFCFLAHL